MEVTECADLQYEKSCHVSRMTSSLVELELRMGECSILGLFRTLLLKEDCKAYKRKKEDKKKKKNAEKQVKEQITHPTSSPTIPWTLPLHIHISLPAYKYP